MSSALLREVNFDSADSWNIYALDHGIAHATVSGRIIAAGKSAYLFPLYDFPREENADYLVHHYLAHKSYATALGLGAIADISQADFMDRRQFNDWHYLHSLIHLAEDNALGISP